MVFGGPGSLEAYAREQCPKAFENWDGTGIEVKFTEDRGVKPSSSCVVTLKDIMGSTYAIIEINVATDEARNTFLAE